MMSGKEFLEKCNAHGGNWAAMIMSGIRNCFPEYYSKMVDKNYEVLELLSCTVECGVVWED